MEIENPKIFEFHAEFCSRLSNPRRLMILALLAKGEKSVGELAKASGVTLTNISQHLTIMRASHIVKARKEGRTVYYSVTDKRIIEACNLTRSVLLEEMKRQGMIAQEVDTQTPMTKM